jgi:hypothetical protein
MYSDIDHRLFIFCLKKTNQKSPRLREIFNLTRREVRCAAKNQQNSSPLAPQTLLILHTALLDIRLKIPHPQGLCYFAKQLSWQWLKIAQGRGKLLLMPAKHYVQHSRTLATLRDPAACGTAEAVGRGVERYGSRIQTGGNSMNRVLSAPTVRSVIAQGATLGRKGNALSMFPNIYPSPERAK